MKAILLRQHGGVDGFFLEEVKEPNVERGHVIIKVEATSVNPVDCKIRRGSLPIGPVLPGVLHGDLAGTITEIGPDVHGFQVGDEVYGCVGGFGGLAGVLSEYVSADCRLLAKKPKNLAMTEAAALPLVGITAWNALIDRANISEGQKILVHAAAGGVGHIALQLAKAKGLEVHATASSEEKMTVGLRLGADRVFNYKNENPKDYVCRETDGVGYDVVFDTVGGDCLDASFEAARINGLVVSIAARSTHDLTPVHLKSLTLHVVFMLLPIIRNQNRESHGLILSKISGLVESQKMIPLIHQNIFDFEEVGKAHHCHESGQAMGKVVLSSSW